MRPMADMLHAHESDAVYASFDEFIRDVVQTELDPSDLKGHRRRLTAHEIQTYARMGTTRDQFLKSEQRTASGMGEAVPADGGFLLHPQWARDLIIRSHQESAVLKRCTEWTISETNAAGLKIPAVDEQSRKDGSRWGGARSYWANEADAVTGSKPKFTNIELNPEKAIIVVPLTNELLTDMGALGRYIPMIMGKEIAFRVTDAVIAGDGAGKPQGATNASCRINSGRAGGGAIVLADVTGMLSRFWVGSRTDTLGNVINDDSGLTVGPKPAWYCHSNVLDQLAKLVITGTNGSAALVYDPCEACMFGYSVIPIEQCPDLGTSGDLILADYNEYILAWRSRGQLDVSMHLYFTTDESAFRLTARVDGNFAWNTPITPYNGTTTQSPVVLL